MATTIDNVTNEQIRRLYDRASRAGDASMQRHCDIALGWGAGKHATDSERQNAREVCAEAIAAAELVG